MITCLVCLIRLHLKTPLSYFQSLSAKLKLGYCIRYLCFSMCFLLSIEYLFYLKDKTCYIIEKEFLEKATQYQLNGISTNLEVYRDLKYRYKKLYGGISLSQNYGYQRIGKRIYTIINNDTVVFHLHRLNSFHPYSHFHNRGKNGDFKGVRSIGISVSYESETFLHPSSRDLLKCIKNNDSIQGKDLAKLVHDKIQYYDQRCIEYKKLLVNARSISFIDFLFYSLLHTGLIAKTTYGMVKFLVLFQTLLFTFISGYMYKILYRILDGE